MPRRAAVLAILIFASLLAPQPLTAQDEPAPPEEFSSENMSLVKNVPYRVLDRDDTDISYGTDIEFATLDGGAGEVQRLEGDERIATAAAISSDTFLAAEDVVIATGAVYADAISGATLAARLKAPLLLSNRGSLPDVTADEITRLGARRAVLLGGEAALSADVASALTDLGLEVDRIEGENRFATAAQIAERAGNGGEVLVALGEDADPERGWETALPAAALGAVHDIPLLLTREGSLPDESAAVIANADDEGTPDPLDVTIIGGEDDVPASVQDEIEALGATVTRVGGDTHYDTSRLAAEESAARGAIRANVVVATGEKFADGLTSAAALGKTGGVLYLVDGQDLSATPQIQESLAGQTVGLLTVAGGPAAISEDTADELSALLTDTGGDRDYAIAGSEYNGMQIADISDPVNTEIVALYDCDTLQGDIQVFTKGDRTFAAFTSEDTGALDFQTDCVRQAVAAGDIVFEDLTGGGEEGDQPDGVPDDLTPAYGTYIADITNPYQPVYGGFIPVPEGSHNMTVHPSGDYAYNSNSSLIVNPATSQGEETTYIEYYDISDLTDITRLGQLDLPIRPGLGTESHDITFSADGTRAYSAALSQTVIINTEDPTSPAVISNFVDPAINVEHQADPVDVVDSQGNERRLLIVEDELAGAAGNGSCPGGGMHIYDITGDNEMNPQLNKVGTYFIPQFRPAGTGSGQGEALTCTAHVFRIYPEQGIITIAWYNAGVWVLDISDLADAAQNPTSSPIQTLGFGYHDNSDTWSFKTNTFEADGSFYGFGNDITRGLDVWRYDASAPTATEEMGLAMQGRWVDQGTAIAMANQALQANGYQAGQQAAPRCLLLNAEQESRQLATRASRQ